MRKALNRRAAEIGSRQAAPQGRARASQKRPLGIPAADPWLRMRLRSILRKRRGGSGRGRGRDHRGWPNRCFAGQGLPLPAGGQSRGNRQPPAPEQPADWRAVRGRSARTVRREGRRKPMRSPYLYRSPAPQKFVG